MHLLYILSPANLYIKLQVRNVWCIFKYKKYKISRLCKNRSYFGGEKIEQIFVYIYSFIRKIIYKYGEQWMIHRSNTEMRQGGSIKFWVFSGITATLRFCNDTNLQNVCCSFICYLCRLQLMSSLTDSRRAYGAKHIPSPNVNILGFTSWNRFPATVWERCKALKAAMAQTSLA